MLRKTHLAIGLAVGLHLFPIVNNKLIFLPVLIIASLLPDIDSKLSSLGNFKPFRVLQAASSHRGILHSYTLCIAISLVFAFFYPIVAFPFFLGYSFHLLADSFTVQGIRPFWPFKVVSAGKVTTGGRTEDIIFWIFAIIDVFLVVFLFV